MVYTRRKQALRPKKKMMKRKVVRKTSSALTVAKRALKVATQVAKGATETKYLSYSLTSDIAGTGGALNSAILRDLTSTVSTTPLFDSDPLSGNKAFLKYVKGTWEIDMANEEECVNFTVAVFKLKSDMEGIGTNMTNHVSTIQGQAYFDPRFIKVLYYKHFAMYPGGSLNTDRSGGTAVRTGSFFIPVNKMIRFTDQGASGQQNDDYTLSYQDRVYFAVYTDNTSIDTENPRINLRTLSCWRGTDINF